MDSDTYSKYAPTLDSKSQHGDTSSETHLEMEDRLGNSKHEDEEERPPQNGFLASRLHALSSSTESFIKDHSKAIKYMWIAILNMAIFAYFFSALHYWINYERDRGWQWCNGFGLLLILMIVVYSFLFYFLIAKRICGRTFESNVAQPIRKFYEHFSSSKIISISFYLLLLAIAAAFIIYDTWGESERIISLLGLVVLLVLGYVFSAKRRHIKWRPVIWGLALQFVFGLLTIRWEVGRNVFKCFGDKVTTFLEYAKAGASFVYGDNLVLKWGVFAFASLTVLIFFSTIVEILYYWGAMQWFCLKLGWFLQITCGTTVCESVISVANVFIGNTESPLMVRPYLKDLTPSEVHTLMSSGFATISGTLMAAYVSFGAEANHLITASIMSAPAAICYSKLFYPETRISKTSLDNIQMVPSTETTVIGAAAKGACAGIPMIINIIANLIGFISIVALINGLLGFFGGLVGFPLFSLEYIFGKIFIPLSWVMGVPWSECEYVATLVGIKTIVNEFVAYQKMGEYKKAGLLSIRAEAIATYALCGFTNPGTAGILIGVIGGMAPNQKDTLTRLAFRSFFAGCAICFMTACIAGLLTTDGSFQSNLGSNRTMFNSTY